MKRKLTLSIDEQVIELAKLDNVNISNLLEEYLRNYLETSSVEEIDAKIEKTKTKIDALQKRRTQMLEEGMKSTKTQGIIDNIWAELRQFYQIRINQGISDFNSDIDWLHSPKNLRRCKIIGKDPLLILNELRNPNDNVGIDNK